jgi:hypothetical protein
MSELRYNARKCKYKRLGKMSKRELVDEIKRVEEDLSITARRLSEALYELKVSRAVCYAWKTQALGDNPHKP